MRRARPLTPRRREEQTSADFGEQALAIALELRHPAYDCFYLVLAVALEVEMITADARLADRCRGTRFERHLRRL